MGYRSDVSLTMKKEDVIELLKQAAEKDENHNASAYLCLDNILDHKDGYLSLYWEWIKWYDDYEEITFIKQFINKAVCNGKDVSFKRIGEDNEDYESEWNGNEEVCEKVEFVRMFDINFSDAITENEIFKSNQKDITT